MCGSRVQFVKQKVEYRENQAMRWRAAPTYMTIHLYDSSPSHTIQFLLLKTATIYEDCTQSKSPVKTLNTYTTLSTSGNHGHLININQVTITHALATRTPATQGWHTATTYTVRSLRKDPYLPKSFLQQIQLHTHGSDLVGVSGTQEPI